MTDQSLDFSIIIPVYNAEQTLSRCLNSIIRQTLSNFEVLIINDGSVDNSNEICSHYAKNDERFKLLNQKNAGPSIARNRGLDSAIGKYVVFIDSDDFVEPNFLECIKEAFLNSETEVLFMGYNCYSSQGELVKQCIPNINSQNYFETIVMLSDDDMLGYTWIKSFTRKVIGNIRFPENVDLFEDEIFTCKVLKKCTKINAVTKPLYNYILGNESTLTNKVHQNYCELQDKVYTEWKKLFASYSDYKRVVQNRSKKMIITSIYYGFEKKLNPVLYFKKLSNCSFFVESNCDTFLTKCIKKHMWIIVLFIRSMYRTKLKIASTLHHT